jgi:hypothetical protein
VAEPDPALCARISREVGRSFEVVAVEGWEQAVERLGEDPGGFDLLLLALRCGDGPLAVEQALRLGRRLWPQVGIVVFGSTADEGVTRRCLDLGALDVVTAGPLQTGTLPSRLEAAAVLAAMRRENGTSFAGCGRRLLAPEGSERSDPVDGGLHPAPEQLPVRPFEEVQRECYEAAFRACNGNITVAAKKLRVPYTSYRRDLERFGVHQPRRRAAPPAGGA